MFINPYVMDVLSINLISDDCAVVLEANRLRVLFDLVKCLFSKSGHYDVKSCFGFFFLLFVFFFYILNGNDAFSYPEVFPSLGGAAEHN